MVIDDHPPTFLLDLTVGIVEILKRDACNLDLLGCITDHSLKQMDCLGVVEVLFLVQVVKDVDLGEVLDEVLYLSQDLA